MRKAFPEKAIAYHLILAQVLLHGGLETSIQALKEGAFGYIQKPVDYDQLEIEVKRALEKQEMQRRLDQYVRRLEVANAELEKLFQQLSRDYEIAEKVFEKVICNNDHRNCPNIKFFQAPMSNVAGDLILIAVGPTGNQSIFLGDFTGHGLSAAIGAIPVSDIFYTMTEKGHSIAEIVTETNRKLKSVLPTGLFLCAMDVTVFLRKALGIRVSCDPHQRPLLMSQVAHLI